MFRGTVEIGHLHLPAGTCCQLTDRPASYTQKTLRLVRGKSKPPMTHLWEGTCMSMRAQGCHVLKRLLLAGVSAPALVVPVRGDCAHLSAHAHRMHSRPGVLCVQETLRMYPPVGIGQGRVCQNHDTIVGWHLHLPAGTCIAMPHHTSTTPHSIGTTMTSFCQVSHPLCLLFCCPLVFIRGTLGP